MITLASVGPIGIGAIRDATGGWAVPLVVLGALLVPQLMSGTIANRERHVLAGHKQTVPRPVIGPGQERGVTRHGVSRSWATKHRGVSHGARENDGMITIGKLAPPDRADWEVLFRGYNAFYQV